MEPVKVPVFDIQFTRGTPVGPTEQERARLKRTSDAVRRLLTDSGSFELIPIQAAEAEVEKTGDLRACGGCTGTYTKTLGASATFVGDVQNVSGRILNMNI